MNPNLYAVAPSAELRFKFATFNIDQAKCEEEFANTKWEVRAPRVKALIDDINADIICLQELRRLPGVKQTTEQFLASFPQYRFIVEYRNASPMAFGQAILYRPDKFYPVQTRKFWLSETPTKPSDTWALDAAGTTGSGYIVLAVEFMAVVGDGKLAHGNEPFWVFNNHFGFEEDLKTRSCVALAQIVKSTTDGQRFLVCGDLNLFPDRDADKQRKIFQDAGWLDFGIGALTLSGRPVVGTFIGYDHDKFKSDLNNMQSRLDHVLGGPSTMGLRPTLHTKTMLPDGEPAELTTRTYPSDHLPLTVDVIIFGPSYLRVI